MAEQGRHVLTEDEQDERYGLRALLEVWGHRVEETENGARGIELALDRRPERGMTRLLRAGLGLLVVPLVVACARAAARMREHPARVSQQRWAPAYCIAAVASGEGVHRRAWRLGR